MPDYDFIILGQGLAGTALAWQLIFRRQRVLVLDNLAPRTASRIAAGLVTPITGQRMVPSWRFQSFWRTATEFYRRVEVQTRARFWYEQPAVRILQSNAEAEQFKRRWQDAEFTRLVQSGPTGTASGIFTDKFGAFEMQTAARLNVPEYLRASRHQFLERQVFRQTELDLRHDLCVEAHRVLLPRLRVTASHFVFCQGIQAAVHPWFSSVQFDAAKGEMLRVSIPNLDEPRTIHHRVWMARVQQHEYCVGATYDRDHLNSINTQAARDEIELKLSSLVQCPYQVISQSAAVRPVVVGRHPVIGRHPQWPQLSYFNGLGSKGSLQSPGVAAKLAGHLVQGIPIDEELDLHLRFC